MERDYWFKVVGLFTIIGAIAALLVVPEVRRGIGLELQDSTKLDNPKQALPFQSSYSQNTVQASPSTTSRNNETRTVLVNARTMWVDTGIDVTGKRVRIRYESGQWRNHPTSAWNTGDGLSPYEEQHLLIVPRGALAALVGKTNKGAFPVGTSYEGAAGSGRLYLSMNDLSGYFNDNEGSLTVTVSVLE
jgi:hypothetical protein